MGIVCWVTNHCTTISRRIHDKACFYVCIAISRIAYFFWLVNYLMPLGKKLQNLNFQKILIISVVYSIINSFMHNTYLLISEGLTLEKYQSDSLLMFTGDFLGSLIFLFSISLYKKEIFKVINKYI